MISCANIYLSEGTIYKNFWTWKSYLMKHALVATLRISYNVQTASLWGFPAEPVL
jgi:hypothetical protein